MASSPAGDSAPGVRSTLEDFVFEERVGSGSFGIVWRAVRKQDGLAYAIKEIDLQGLSKKVGRMHARGAPGASTTASSGTRRGALIEQRFGNRSSFDAPLQQHGPPGAAGSRASSESAGALA
jgi:serine/threonine protein kinase